MWSEAALWCLSTTAVLERAYDRDARRDTRAGEAEIPAQQHRKEPVLTTRRSTQSTRFFHRHVP